jgi:hypothetical protein
MVVTAVLELNIGEAPSRIHRKQSITQTEQKDRGAGVIKGKGEIWSKKTAKQVYGVLDTEEKMGVYGPTPQDHVS